MSVPRSESSGDSEALPAQGGVPRAQIGHGRTGTGRLGVITRLLRWAAPRYSFVEDEILGLATVVRPGDVCFDIGAEFGLYTYPLSQLVGPDGVVHSFEPLPGPMRVLSAGVRTLGCANVRRYPIALGREPGHGELSLPRRRGLPVHGRAFLTNGAKDQGPNVEFASSSAVKVEVASVDTIATRAEIDRVDFIKADVEGAEPAVLDGAAATISAFHPTLLLEIEERHLAKYGTGSAELTDRLTELGYRMHTWQSGGWRRATEVTDDRRNYLFSTDAISD
jgi:FkbM family methyltransferase